jgi:hypothetical protein
MSLAWVQQRSCRGFGIAKIRRKQHFQLHRHWVDVGENRPIRSASRELAFESFKEDLEDLDDVAELFVSLECAEMNKN